MLEFYYKKKKFKNIDFLKHLSTTTYLFLFYRTIYYRTNMNKLENITNIYDHVTRNIYR